MRKAWLAAALLLCLISVGGMARAEDSDVSKVLPAVIDPVHGEQLTPWVEALGADGIEVNVLKPEAFAEIKAADYGCVFGVAQADDKTYPLLQKAFTREELEKLAVSPNRVMQIKRDLWKDGQRILFFVGSTPTALDDVRKNMRSAWWPYLCSWYDIENTSMHGY